MPNPLISFRIEPELLDALDRFASANGLDRTTVIRNAVSQYINVPIDPIDDRLTALEVRVAELERRLETTDSGTAFLPQPITTDAQRALDRVESRIAEFSQPEGEGLSQEKLKQLCKCNDRIFPKIRDDPEKLAEFTLKRTGLVYEYRKGKYYPK